MVKGARLGSLTRAPSLTTLIFSLVVMLSCPVMSSSFGASDTEILLKFKGSLEHSNALNNWDPNVEPCERNRGNWAGVICLNGNVRGLQLENMGLMGTIDVDSLVSLRYLRTLSFMNNTFTGTMPTIKKLSALRSVYLSYNHFSGEIPDDAFAGMSLLKKVFLTNNEFTGKIPSSLATLPGLLVLRLDENKFQGHIPNFQQKDSLKKFNVSNNNLEGPIPASLSNLETSSFSGNEYLCGPPLESCESCSRRQLVLKIVIVVIMVVLFVAVVAALCSIFYLRKQSSVPLDRRPTLRDQMINVVASYPNQAGELKLPESTGHRRKVEHGKLSFIRDDRDKFGLQDLLKSSAEVLGSATFGSSYKATITGGQTLVVKRYRQMNNVGREEFNEHMRRLGTLSHPNLLPLVAYYYRREEKLLISDFVENGSLASLLHGKHNENQPPPDWPTRLRIIKGVARGLAYLYDAIPSLTLPHGHLKSSNVLLDESFEPLLADYALSPVINPDLSRQTMMAYKSPEYAQHGSITKKTDIWSFGVLILEILTGRFPENYLTQVHDTDTDLASWVNKMITGKRMSEVFDLDIGGAKSSKGELLKLLKIGLSCCEQEVERRLDIKDVVEKIEEFKEEESEGENYASSVINDGDANALRGV